MGAEDLAWKRILADVGEEVPEAEDVADLVHQRFDLFLMRLREHLWIQNQLMAAGVRKEGAGQHAAVGITVVRPAHDDLEVPGIALFAELHRRRITPGKKRLTKAACGSSFSPLRGS